MTQPALFAGRPGPAVHHTESWAYVSDCGRYRYVLGRKWGPGPTCVFVMLNPSTADAMQDDPTIRRCVGFARRDGFGSLEVVNLFAWRATDPAELAEVADPVGPKNDEHIRDQVAEADRIVVAWGAHPAAIARAARAPLPDVLWCLGTTKAGHPRHPLYLRGDTPLVRWPRG